LLLLQYESSASLEEASSQEWEASIMATILP
jgi:hypothetical protein